MYRAYIHITLPGGLTIRLTSETVETEDAASSLLIALRDLPGTTGGDLETHVPGIGWVLGGSTEAESAAWLHRASGRDG